MLKDDFILSIQYLVDNIRLYQKAAIGEDSITGNDFQRCRRGRAQGQCLVAGQIGGVGQGSFIGRFFSISLEKKF